MKSKIKCRNCGNCFMIDENDLEASKEIKCPECSQPFDEKMADQLKNAFKSLHEYQKG